MGQGDNAESTHSSPLLRDGATTPEGPALQVDRSGGSASTFYRLPTLPRNVSICQLAGGASEEESMAHKRIQRKLLAALVLAFIFMIVEVVGGVMAHSLAIITDAAHLLSDVSGFAVAVLAAVWAKRKSHEHFSYGYHRVEVLGALASVMTVWLVTGILLFEAVQRIITPEPVDGKLMFIIAVVGVCVNIVMMAILGHHHGHGSCSHSHPQEAPHHHSHSGHSHAHSNGHGLLEAEGSGHGRSGAKPQLDTVLEAAELSRSSSRAEGASPSHGGSAHPHSHAHGHSCSGGHDHSGHKHSADDLAAAEEGHSSHSGHYEEEAQHAHASGHTPMLAAAAERSCHADHEHGAAHGHKHGDGCSGHGHAHGGSGAAVAAAPAPQGGSCSGGGHGHSHSHGHGHDHSNMNVRGAIIHVIGDFVQSIGVAIAGALIWWHQDNPAWFVADPICTFLFAALVLWTTRAILRDISDVLMERVPRGLCIKTINDDLSRVEGVEEVHDLHVWSLTPGIPLLCAHVNLSVEADATAVLHTMNAYCRDIGIQHSTIQLVVNGNACPCAV